MSPLILPEFIVVLLPRLAEPEYLKAFLIVLPFVLLAVVASVMLALRIRKLRSQERLFDAGLDERKRAIATAAHASSTGDADLLQSGADILEYSMGDGDAAMAQQLTLALPEDWINPEPGDIEQMEHIRARCAFHAKNWLANELQHSELHPVQQSHMYNLLYSLGNAELQIKELKKQCAQNHDNNGLARVGRTKPHYKLVLPGAEKTTE